PAATAPPVAAPSLRNVPNVVKTATMRIGKAGSLAIGTGSAAITAAWGKTGLASGSAVLTATLDPAAVSGQGGAATGTTAIEITVKASSGKSVGRFASPLDLRFRGAAGNVVPAFSANGKNWMAVPDTESAVLPAKFTLGYERDRLGTLHILTRKPGYFGLL